MLFLHPVNEWDGRDKAWGIDQKGEQWFFKRSNGIRFLHEWMAAEIGERLDLPVLEIQISQMAGACGVAIKDVGSVINYESDQFNEIIQTIQVDWELLATVAVFDILICNMDRGLHNWCFQ